MLEIEGGVEYSDIITNCEYHTHKPYASSTFKNNDEIRIAISQQDIITAPFESSLHISGKVTAKNVANTNTDVSLINNAMAFLFEDIRYELGGIVVDRTKNVGIVSTMKNLLSIRQNETNALNNACWFGPGNTLKTNEFTFSIPLKLLLGFCEDYRKIIANVKQEIILLRNANDTDVVLSEDADSHTLEITDLYWRVPHISVSDGYKEKLLRLVNKDTPIHLPFRSWEFHEYPTLPLTKRHNWSVKTSSQIEKPRYVVLTFQTGRKNNLKKDMSCFDHCNLEDIKLYLNSQYYPYDNVRGNWSLFYEMYARFQSSYYGSSNSPIMNLDTFKEKCPLFVIDCSKQNDSLRSGPVDVRIEFEFKDNVPQNTTAYCLIIHDSHLMYTLLTNTIRSMT